MERAAAILRPTSSRATAEGQAASDRSNYEKGIQILARTLFREMLSGGYESRHVLILCAELIGLVTKALKH